MAVLKKPLIFDKSPLARALETSFDKPLLTPPETMTIDKEYSDIIIWNSPIPSKLIIFVSGSLKSAPKSLHTSPLTINIKAPLPTEDFIEV